MPYLPPRDPSHRTCCLVLGLALSLFACAGSGPATLPQELDSDGYPAWVNLGTTTFKSGNNRLFHGVAQVSMEGDFSRQALNVDRLAQQALDRLLADYIEIVTRHYLATDGGSQSGFTRQKAAEQIEQLAQLQLSRATVVGHWKDTSRNQLYAVAQFDLPRLRHAISTIESVDRGFEHFFDLQAARIFDRMASRDDL